MKSYINFTFNGIKSVDIGVCNIFIDDMPMEILAANREVISTKALYGDNNIVSRINLENLTISLKISPLNKSFTSELIQKIYDWFDVDDYCKLSFADSRNFYYRCIPFVGERSEITMFIDEKGYFPIMMQCDAGHGYVDIIKENHLFYHYQNSFDFNFKNKHGIKINGNYEVPIFISCNLSNNGSVNIKSSASDNIFRIKSLPNSINKIDVDNESGIVLCDNEIVNPYLLCENIDSLYIEGNKDNIITVSKPQDVAVSITIGASIPCITSNKTIDISHTLDNYVVDDLELFYDGLTGLGDKSNKFCELVSGREIEVSNGIEQINSDGSVLFDGDTYIESNKVLTSPYITVEIFCKYSIVKNAEQSLVNTFESIGFGISNINKKNQFIAWIDDRYEKVVSSYETELDTPYHLVGVVDDKNMYLYENGQKYIVPISGVLKHNNYGVEIGKNCFNLDKTFYFNGGIYTVRLYNRALTEEEVIKNYKEDKRRYGF